MDLLKWFRRKEEPVYDLPDPNEYLWQRVRNATSTKELDVIEKVAVERKFHANGALRTVIRIQRSKMVAPNKDA
jgi:hypothetical protein